MIRAVRTLFQQGAVTEAGSSDPALRGRTYGVPWDRVWREALALASVAMPGWSVLEADDGEGLIRAEIRGRHLAPPSEVLVWIGLDPDAQTRVELRSVSEGVRMDLGANRRRIRAFCRALDGALGTPSVEVGTS